MNEPQTLPTMTLKDLKGKPGLTKARLVHSRTVALRVVRAGETATAAGNHGALNIWRDRNGKLRASFYRYKVACSEVLLPTVSDLDRWLRKWWPSLSSDSLPD